MPASGNNRRSSSARHFRRCGVASANSFCRVLSRPCCRTAATSSHPEKRSIIIVLHTAAALETCTLQAAKLSVFGQLNRAVLYLLPCRFCLLFRFDGTPNLADSSITVVRAPQAYRYIRTIKDRTTGGPCNGVELKMSAPLRISLTEIEYIIRQQRGCVKLY